MDYESPQKRQALMGEDTPGSLGEVTSLEMN